MPGKSLGLPGGGPALMITPECIMDFDPETKHARLRYLCPGVTADQVQAKTGFALPAAPELCELPLPTDDEMPILRDQGGSRRHTSPACQGSVVHSRGGSVSRPSAVSSAARYSRSGPA